MDATLQSGNFISSRPTAAWWANLNGSKSRSSLWAVSHLVYPVEVTVAIIRDSYGRGGNIGLVVGGGEDRRK